MMLVGNVSLYPHTSVYQRLYTICDISVGVGASENVAAEYDSIIHLGDVGTWINGVEHIRQGYDYISSLRCEFSSPQINCAEPSRTKLSSNSLCQCMGTQLK